MSDLNLTEISSLIAILRDQKYLEKKESSNPKWNFNYGAGYYVDPVDGRVCGDHTLLALYYLLGEKTARDEDTYDPALFKKLTGMPVDHIHALAFPTPPNWMRGSDLPVNYALVTPDDVAQVLYTYMMFGGTRQPDWSWWFLSHPHDWPLTDDVGC